MCGDETGHTSLHSLDSSISLMDTSDVEVTPEDSTTKRRMRPPLLQEDVLIRQHLEFLEMLFDNDAHQTGVGWTDGNRAQARIDTWATLVNHDSRRVVAAAKDHADLVRKGDLAMERITKMHEDPNKEANDLSPIPATDKGMNAAAWRKHPLVHMMSAKHPLDAPDYQSKRRLQAMQGMQHQQPQRQQQQGLEQKQENQPRQDTPQQQQQQHQRIAAYQESQQHTEQATATQGVTKRSK